LRDSGLGCRVVKSIMCVLVINNLCECSGLLPNEFGTSKTVKTRFWPWISGKVLEICSKIFSLCSEAVRVQG
jgi:hypothetical protein